MAAVRFAKQGMVEAMAAGGLKRFRTDEMTVDLPERADVALWHDSKGEWQGVLLGHDGPVPDSLARITPNWHRLKTPISLRSR
jgi:hypothetical protein